MDLAFCVGDGELWDARTLSDEAKKQPDGWLETRRPTIVSQHDAELLFTTALIFLAGLGSSDGDR